jgi:hypothetical protein
MKYHFYGFTTDLYTTVLERTPVHEKSVKAFHSGDEYVAILHYVATQSPFPRRYSSILNSYIATHRAVEAA